MPSVLPVDDGDDEHDAHQGKACDGDDDDDAAPMLASSVSPSEKKDPPSTTTAVDDQPNGADSSSPPHSRTACVDSGADDRDLHDAAESVGLSIVNDPDEVLQTGQRPSGPTAAKASSLSPLPPPEDATAVATRSGGKRKREEEADEGADEEEGGENGAGTMTAPNDTVGGESEPSSSPSSKTDGATTERADNEGSTADLGGAASIPSAKWNRERGDVNREGDEGGDGNGGADKDVEVGHNDDAAPTTHGDDEKGNGNIDDGCGRKRTKNDLQWDMMFEKLTEYKRKHGDCLVPKRCKEEPRLGTWVETQRLQYKKLLIAAMERASASAIGGGGTPLTTDATLTNEDGTAIDPAFVGIAPSKRMSADRLLRLASVGFAWEGRPGQKKRTATSSSPSSSNRRRKKRGTPGAGAGPTSASSTPSDAAPGEEADPAGFGAPMSGVSHRKRSFDEMYDRLVSYQKLHGDCRVPPTYGADRILAAWAARIRSAYRKNVDEESRIHQGIAGGSTAGIEKEHGARGMFIEGEGETEEAPKRHDVGGDDGAVSSAMAQEEERNANAYKKPLVVAAARAAVVKRHEEELKKLDPEASDVTDEVKEGESLAADSTKATGASEGAAAVPPKEEPQGVEDIDGVGLTEERTRRLEALGFDFTSIRKKGKNDHWEDMFQKLLEYKAEHGDCLVPSRYKKEHGHCKVSSPQPNLGKWVETQRYEYTKLCRAGKIGGVPKPMATFAPMKKESASDKPRKLLKLRLTEERFKRLESIGFSWKVKHKMKKYYDKQWNAMFAKLVAYKNEHNDCLVPKRYAPEPKLATWVQTQRAQYRKLFTREKDETTSPVTSEGGEGKGNDEVNFRLTEDRRRRLESIGFSWTVPKKASRPVKRRRVRVAPKRNSYDEQWDSMFLRLAQWKEEKGHCLVPKRCKEDPKLGTWVDTQRVQYKRLQRKIAEAEEAKTTTAQAFTGQDHDTGESLLHDGDSTVLPDELKELPAPDKPLVGRLTDERIKRLESLGFVWHVRDDWQTHYEELVKFKEKTGHCNVPARFKENRKLGIWVSAQRQNFKLVYHQDQEKARRTPLTPKRVELLNALGFTWIIRTRDSFGESWNQRLEDLKQYRAQHGNCLVPSRYDPKPELGVWVTTQRAAYRNYMRAKEEGRHPSQLSAMNDERIAQLDALGFVWALRSSDNVWARRISELKHHKDSYGTVDVHERMPARLRTWIGNQRAQYRLFREGKHSSMTDAKVAELDALEFEWSTRAAPTMVDYSVPTESNDGAEEQSPSQATTSHVTTYHPAAPPPAGSALPIGSSLSHAAQAQAGSTKDHVFASAHPVLRTHEVSVTSGGLSEGSNGPLAQTALAHEVNGESTRFVGHTSGETLVHVHIDASSSGSSFQHSHLPLPPQHSHPPSSVVLGDFARIGPSPAMRRQIVDAHTVELPMRPDVGSGVTFLSGPTQNVVTASVPGNVVHVGVGDSTQHSGETNVDDLAGSIFPNMPAAPADQVATEGGHDAGDQTMLSSTGSRTTPPDMFAASGAEAPAADIFTSGSQRAYATEHGAAAANEEAIAEAHAEAIASRLVDASGVEPTNVFADGTFAHGADAMVNIDPAVNGDNQALL